MPSKHKIEVRILSEELSWCCHINELVKLLENTVCEDMYSLLFRIKKKQYMDIVKTIKECSGLAGITNYQNMPLNKFIEWFENDISYNED